MSDLLITLISCAAMILGSARLGYIYARRYMQEEIIDALRDAWELEFLYLDKIHSLERQLSSLLNKLAKFQQPPRGKNGKFLKWKEKSNG